MVPLAHGSDGGGSGGSKVLTRAEFDGLAPDARMAKITPNEVVDDED